MKALQIEDLRRLRLIDVPAPTLRDGEILLRVKYVGFCGSDLNTFRGLNTMAKSKVVPGHELGAEICAIGASVPDHFSIGQVVTVNPYTHCGVCASCRAGRYNACEYNETLGVQRDGAMCEYVSLPWQKVIPSQGISVRDSALIEPMSVGFHAVARGQVSDTDTVLVIGCGMVGLGAVIRSVHRGATVIAADIDAHKLEFAKEVGAAYCYNTADEWVDLPSPSVVIEAVGSPATYRMALERVDYCGRVVCIGYAKADVLLPTGAIVKKEAAVVGSRNATMSDFESVIRILKQGSVPLDRFVSAVISPSEAQKSLEGWDAAPGRILRILTQWNIDN